MSAPNKENILFIFTDQHRKDFLPCYGSEHGIAPALDRLAQDGIVFDNAYTVTPVCTPARASVQTGLYPCKHGMQGNLFASGCLVHELPDSPSLLPRRMKAAGYIAGYTGKWHLGYGKQAYEDPHFQQYIPKIDACLRAVTFPDPYCEASSLPSDLGYEGDDFPGHGGSGLYYPQMIEYLKQRNLQFKVDNKGGYGPVISPPESTIDWFLGDRAVQLLRDFNSRRNPFFFSLNFWGPHDPAFVPEEYLKPWENVKFEPWMNFDYDMSLKPGIHGVTRENRDWSYFEEHMHYSYGYQYFIDSQIQRVLATCDELGIYDDMWIVFASDHGDSQGCHGGLINKGFHMYEETASIPLIIKPPKGYCAGTRNDKLINTTDIYQTFIDIASGEDRNSDTHGRSLVPFCRGEEVADWPEIVVTECMGPGFLAYSQRMIRRGDNKYVWNPGCTDELYNLAEDPYEMNNLINKSTVLRDEMRQELIRWMAEHDDLVYLFHPEVFQEGRWN